MSAGFLGVVWAAIVAAQTPPCADRAGPLTRAPTERELAELRRFVHAVAREEGVDPHALEAIGMVETGMRSSIGAHCEIGQFQIMPFWAERFGLESPRLLFDPRYGAVAAARIFRHGFERWDPRYARLGRNACFAVEGRKRGPISRLVFAALQYNYGRAAAIARGAPDLTKVELPESACRYAVRFERELAAARRRARSS